METAKKKVKVTRTWGLFYIASLFALVNIVIVAVFGSNTASNVVLLFAGICLGAWSQRFYREQKEIVMERKAASLEFELGHALSIIAQIQQGAPLPMHLAPWKPDD